MLGRRRAEFFSTISGFFGSSEQAGAPVTPRELLEEEEEGAGGDGEEV